MEGNPTSWLARILARTGDGLVVTDEAGRIILFNTAAEALFGYSAEEVLGRRVEILMPKRFRRAHREWVRSFAEDRKSARRTMGQLREIVALRKGRVEVPVEVMLSGESFGDGAMLIALVRDVSERKRAEEQQRLLAGELGHQVRNILAVVQSIARQSLHTSSSPEHFVEAFNGRLTALARAHDVLAQGNKEGKRLDALIAEQVRPGTSGEEDRVAIHGPSVALSPEAALSLALTFHELATNAAKYGALSVPDGHIEVEWRREERWDGRYLVLEWTELGGPAVHSPDKRGFGSRLIEQSIAHRLGGAARLQFRPEGVCCRIELPLDANTSGLELGQLASSPFAIPSIRAPGAAPPCGAAFRRARGGAGLNSPASRGTGQSG